MLITINSCALTIFAATHTDVLLTRPTKLADLVIDGKGVYQPDPKNQRQIWWRAAGEVLRTPDNDECDLHSDRGVAGGVTPAVLSTEISRR